MKTLVVTGGIGSGKSAVSAILESKGYAVYDSDSRAKNLYDIDPSVLSKVEEVLNCTLRNASGKFSPRMLSDRIFTDRESLRKVEEIVHPAVFEDFRKWKEALTTQAGQAGGPNGDFCVFESAIYLSLDKKYALDDAEILYVDAPRSVRLERVRKRNPNMSEQDVLERMASQTFSADDSRITYKIDNSSDFKTLQDEVTKLTGSIVVENK